MKKNCEQCGIVFEVSRHKGDKQRFCSPSCSRRWWYENPQIEPHVCLYCGKEFIPKEKNRNKVCSRECGFKYVAVKRKKKKDCLTCGEEIIGAQEPDYCSEECRPKRYCAVCGKELSGQQRKYCSNTCSDILAKEVYMESRELQSGSKECEECGTVFYANSRFNVIVLCSKKCSKKRNKRARRARKREAYSEPYRAIDIYRRDKWKCQLCGKKVNPNLPYTDKMSATIDHITPLGPDGPDSPDNVQLAHRICNSLKGDSREIAKRVDGQLMLVIR